MHCTPRLKGNVSMSKADTREPLPQLFNVHYAGPSSNW
jgi:hypothetical protein